MNHAEVRREALLAFYRTYVRKSLQESAEKLAIAGMFLYHSCLGRYHYSSRTRKVYETYHRRKD